MKKLNKLSKQIQYGLEEAFNRFDEYQFAKYNRATEVKLRDALFLVHPKAKDEEQQQLFDKIVNGSLETPYTWETELSALGQAKYPTEKARRDAFRHKWEEQHPGIRHRADAGHAPEVALPKGGDRDVRRLVENNQCSLPGRAG